MQKKPKWRMLKSRGRFIALLLMVIAIIVVVTAIFWTYSNSFILSIIQLLISFIIFIAIFFSHRDPSAKWAWILIVFAIPIVGISLFFLFGRNKKHIKQFQQKIEKNREFDDRYEAFVPLILEKMDPYQHRQYQFLQTIAPRPMYQNTTVDVQVGQQFFDQLLVALEQATHHIHLEFYIVRADEVTKPLFDVLVKKAQAGVEVRFLVDAGGSFRTLEDQDIQRLVNAGVLFAFFGDPQSLVLDSTVNWRNHRKVAVIDGTIGFIGGFNLGREYVYADTKTKNWRDTNISLVGEAVRSLQTIFLGDWYFSTREDFTKLNSKAYFPIQAPQMTNGIVQIISDGPDTKKHPLKQSLYKLITMATQRIWLTTPYLILPDDILQALKSAALSGVDVRISIPGNPDKKLVYRCTQSYIDELLQAGVQIYLLAETFQHSKVWIFDDHFAACGTANLDYRSLVINFEAMALVSQREVVAKLAEVLTTDFAHSQRIDRRVWQRRPWWHKVSESFIRLFAPIF
ncbi:MAG: cardiolipin synthase [Culicoidibacterales bacterium]